MHWLNCPQHNLRVSLVLSILSGKVCFSALAIAVGFKPRIVFDLGILSEHALLHGHLDLHL